MQLAARSLKTSDHWFLISANTKWLCRTRYLSILFIFFIITFAFHLINVDLLLLDVHDNTVLK